MPEANCVLRCKSRADSQWSWALEGGFALCAKSKLARALGHVLPIFFHFGNEILAQNNVGGGGGEERFLLVHHGGEGVAGRGAQPVSAGNI